MDRATSCAACPQGEAVVRPRALRSPREGIAVVDTFQDPSTEREFTVTNDGERGKRITVAWTGREVGIHYPRGRPHAYRFANDVSEGDRGLYRPAFAVFLVYAGLLIAAAIDWGWPWALLGCCGPWAASGLYHLPGNLRDWDRRVDALAAMAAVSSRVIAVLKSTCTDDDGHTSTPLVPVAAWTSTPNVAPGSWTWWSMSWDLSSLRRRPWWGWWPCDRSSGSGSAARRTSRRPDRVLWPRLTHLLSRCRPERFQQGGPGIHPELAIPPAVVARPVADRSLLSKSEEGRIPDDELPVEPARGRAWDGQPR